jgi:hypothetical protein
MPHPGKNVGSVLLDLLPSASAISELASVQLAIDQFDINRQASRKSRYKSQQSLSVRLTRGAEAKHKLSSVSGTARFRPARFLWSATAWLPLLGCANQAC